MAGLSTGSSLTKRLASCNKSTRDKAFKLLKSWLPLQNQVSDEEMKKIWKGLFYCVWHSDKQIVQMELINRLSSLLVSLQFPLSVQYFEVFLTTMRREWSGIDFLRLDKFYLLIRRFLHYFFLLLKKKSWDLELVSLLMGVLQEKSLLAVDKYPAQGVNYHISGVFLEELKPFLPVRLETLDVLFKPFFSVMKESSDKVLLNKIKSSMFDCLLKNGKKLLELKKAGEVVDSVDEVEVFGGIALTWGLGSKFFDLGSASDCLQGNRKVLFTLHEGFLKLEKDLANAGIVISMPQVDVDDMDEVPDLIPITDLKFEAAEISSEPVEVDMVIANGSADKPSKKSKKIKKASGVTSKKAKLHENGFSDSVVLENSPMVENEKVNEIVANGENSNGDPGNNGNLITFNEYAISNLQMQFEKVAAEVGMNMDGTSSCDSPILPVNGTVSKKRKRVKSLKGKLSHSQVENSERVVGGSAIGKTGEKSAKKVKFSMKNNLVWKPHSPLPPQNLRLPPSTTPRGSALKKGIPAGPIRETPPMMKKKKQRANSSVKKGRKGPKSVSPAIKRLRKLRSMSV